MLDYRFTIAAAGAFMGTWLVGCGDPDLPTDLRTNGPPNVTAVMVMSDLETAIDPDSEKVGALDRYLEDATFCRLDDDKRPRLIGLQDGRTTEVCPDDLKLKAVDDGVAPGAPPDWFVRIVFDRLLDPSIEDLDPVLDPNGMPNGQFVGTLKRTQPVTLTCNDVNILYDGYYVPNGNKESWPPGPALFIRPLVATDAPTGASCTVSIKDNVHSKTGESVPAAQRSYMFTVAPMSFRFSDPAPDDTNDGSITLTTTIPIDLFFTAEVRAGTTITTDPGTPDETTITLSRDLDPAQVNLTSGPNLPSGKADPAVCAGTAGMAVPASKIRVYLLGADPTTSALVLQLDAGGDPAGPTAQMTQLWEPSTTYLLTFADGAAVPARQGGDPAALPGASDFSLCFHTLPLPTN
ncbi:MAG TPA: hypothetical protein VHT91_30050 [Kofleriaceae bacterium]|jgi:hypothetical protein|nr:hypothetical protein [Kofleriaceae bacterium]